MKLKFTLTIFISLTLLFISLQFPNNNPKNESNNEALDWNRSAKFWHSLISDPVTNLLDFNKVKLARENSIKIGTNRSGINLNWKDEGPTNIGGRTRAILFDRTTANGSKVYVGSATGGIFVSYNEGGLWQPISGLPSLPISCMAQHPNGTVFVGTGSRHETSKTGGGSSAKIGSGMYKFDPSNESGSFQSIVSTQLTFSNLTSDIWSNINAIEIDQNSGRIYAATKSGLKYSDDLGSSWKTAINNTSEFLDIAINENGGLLISELDQIYFSLTGDSGSFDNIFQKFNYNSTISGYSDRIELAFSKSNPNYAYALIINNITGGEFGGFYQSKDGGLSWVRIQPNGNFTPFISREGQGRYDAFLAIDPIDPEKVFIGGVQLWKWDGDFERVTSESGTFVGGEYSGLYMHADKHCFAYSHANPNLMLVGNDGGISKSLDAGETFYPASRGYNVTQFYSVATNRHGHILGGTQDNGTVLVAGSNSNFPLEGEEVYGGDGFACAMSSISDMIFATVYEGEIARGNQGNPLGSVCQDWNCNDPNFYTPIKLWESISDPSSKDFISFVAEDGTNKFTLLSTNGIAKNFSGIVHLPQATSKIISGSTRFVAGNQILTDNGNGQLTGDGTGSFDYSTKTYNLSFNTPPANGTELKAFLQLYYNSGDQIILSSNTPGVNKLNQPFEIKHVLTSDLDPGDSISVKDPVQSLLAFGGSRDTLWVLRGAINLNQPADWFPIPLERQLITENFDQFDLSLWSQINGSIGNSCSLLSQALVFDGVSRSLESVPLPLSGKIKLGFDLFQNMVNCDPPTNLDTLFVEFQNNNTGNSWINLKTIILGNSIDVNRIRIDLPSTALSTTTKIRWRQGSTTYNIGERISAIDNILFTQKFDIGRVKSLDFTKDGNYIFIGSMLGRLIRVSGLNQVYKKEDAEPINNKIKCDVLFSAPPRVLTGIGIHPNDDNQLILTLGNYGSYNDYVFYTNSALNSDTSGNGPNGTFQSLQFDLPEMPVFDALISNDPNETVILGTDNGVFCARLPDLLQGIGTWSGLSSTHPLFGLPIFAIEQQKNDRQLASNHGEIYLGTHGRGFWVSNELVGVEDPVTTQSEDTGLELFIYPNPSVDETYINVSIKTKGVATLRLLDIQGKLIKSDNQLHLNKGQNKIRVNLSALTNGSYFVILDIDGVSKFGKIIVNQ